MYRLKVCITNISVTYKLCLGEIHLLVNSFCFIHIKDCLIDIQKELVKRVRGGLEKMGRKRSRKSKEIVDMMYLVVTKNNGEPWSLCSR